MMGALYRVLVVGSLISVMWSAGHAAPVTGNAVAVLQSASATGDDGKRTLEAGVPVYVGERIKTGRTGLVQLIFTDDTKLVIGPNSSLVIETYLLSSRSTVEKFAINALGGSFRFISGKSRKQAYSITTPTATIGIRGTGFDIAVRPSFTDLLALFGVPELCSNRNCILLRDACSLARAPRNGNVIPVDSQERRNRLIRARFPFIVSQRRLRPEFRMPTPSCLFTQKSERRDEDGRKPPAVRRGFIEWLNIAHGPPSG